MKFDSKLGEWVGRERFCSVAAAVAGAAVAGVAGAAISANAAEKSAGIQASAADRATAAQQAQFQQTQATLAPFVNLGTTAGTNLLGPLLTSGQLTAPFNPTIQQLQSTPGYQFTLNQGEQAVQNGAAANGLGISGAEQKGEINYAEGLAGTTFQQQFQNYLAQNQQTFNMLSSTASLGENAAAQTGNIGASTQNSVSNLLTGAANASAAGVVGSANAISSGLNSASSGALNGLLISKAFPSGASTTSSNTLQTAFPNSTTDFGAVDQNQLLSNAGFTQ